MNNNKESIHLKLYGLGDTKVGPYQDSSIWIEREIYSYLSDEEWNTLLENEERLINMINDEIEDWVEEKIIDYVDVIVGNNK